MAEHQDDPPRILTAPEAAARLRISRSTLYDLLDAGLIPHHRMGQGGRRVIRIEADAVDAYFESCKVTGPKPTSEPEVKSALRHIKMPKIPQPTRQA